jgi:hypothetical protein
MAYRECMLDWRGNSWVRNCIWRDIYGKSVETEKNKRENVVIMIDVSDK